MHGVIVAGVSRAGKTTLTERLHKATGFSMLSGDLLVSAIGDGFPQLGIRHGNPHRQVTDDVWLFFSYLMKVHTHWEGRPFIFDATYLDPEKIAAANLHTEYPVVFLGYPHLSVGQKLAAIRKHDAPDDWTAKRDDAKLSHEIAALIELSGELQQACYRLGLPFFDTGADFQGQSEAAFRHVMARLLNA